MCVILKKCWPICILLVLFLDLANADGSDLSDCGYRQVIPGDLRTQTPWSVGVFIRSSANKNFRYFVTGTVLSPWTVLILNGGPFGKNPKKRFIPNPKNLKVVAGLSSNRLEDEDVFTQSPEVEYIIPFTQHSTDNQLYHLYLIRLKSALNLLTPFARAICIPRRDDQLWNVSSSGMLLGGYSPRGGLKSSKYLNIQDVKMLEKSSCVEYVATIYPNRTIMSPTCGVAVKGSQMSSSACVLHGGSLFYNVPGSDGTDQFFLSGVNAVIPSLKNRKCNLDSVYLFGSFDDSLQWILNNLKCEPQRFACNSGKCIPWENLCNGYGDCENGQGSLGFSEDENPVFCHASDTCDVRGFNSEYKYHRCGLFQECIDQGLVCNGVSNCRNNGDELHCNGAGDSVDSGTSDGVAVVTKPVDENLLRRNKTEDVTEELRPCYPIQLSEGVVMRCRNPETEEEVACSKAIFKHEMILECDYQYKPKGRTSFVKLKCGQDSLWTRNRNFGCELDCGIINTGFTSFLTYGKRTSSKYAFPWYAALYMTKNPPAGSREFICGGNLIERNIILTAAHCVTDDFGNILPNEQYSVILSPISGIFEANVNDTYAQVMEVNSIHVPRNYDPKNLQSDIAIVELKGSASFNNFVRPVCYLPPFYKDLTPGIIGKIAGLGYDENRVVSKVIKFTAFPVISNEDCIEALDEVPPLNTFCAGYQNGSAVCKGDSGGGLVFRETNSQLERYVLKGIVSHADSSSLRICDIKNYSVFTYVDAFGEWIQNVLRNIEKSHREQPV